MISSARERQLRKYDKRKREKSGIFEMLNEIRKEKNL